MDRRLTTRRHDFSFDSLTLWTVGLHIFSKSLWINKASKGQQRYENEKITQVQIVSPEVDDGGFIH